MSMYYFSIRFTFWQITFCVSFVDPYFLVFGEYYLQVEGQAIIFQTSHFHLQCAFKRLHYFNKECCVFSAFKKWIACTMNFKCRYVDKKNVDVLHFCTKICNKSLSSKPINNQHLCRTFEKFLFWFHITPIYS